MVVKTTVWSGDGEDAAVLHSRDMAAIVDERPVPRVSVVIPARNEAANLPYVFTRLPHDVYEVILVDGHSVDDTVSVARSLLPTVQVIEQTGTGKGAALQEGFAACTGDIIVMLDADGSTDAAEIPRFVTALLQGADFVKGSRYLSGGGSADISGFRSLGNRALTRLVNTLFGTRFTDLCYGYNAFWRSSLPYFPVDQNGFEVETLINVRAAKADLIIHEVPSFEGNRVHGLSNLKAIPDGWRVLKTIVRERLHPAELKKRRFRIHHTGYGWDGVERRGNDTRIRNLHSSHASFGRRAYDQSVVSPTRDRAG